MDIKKRLSAKKNASRLSQLKGNLVSGAFEQKKRKENEEKLKKLLTHSLFLKEDENRRKKWIQSIPKISDDMLEKIIPAVIREELRYKQKERNLVVELNKKHPIKNFG